MPPNVVSMYLVITTELISLSGEQFSADKNESVNLLDPSMVFSTFKWDQLENLTTRLERNKKLPIKSVKLPTLKVIC